MKWILVIPHGIVLAFLWLAFTVLTVLAFFAILFTGRYPRAIFDFNVGVLRWTWRVAFYAYGALGTDSYPPFTLAEVPDYPAHLEIEYPQHLSRGLVLVKWWLLAIPHYIVVAFFIGAGGWAVGRGGDEAWIWTTGLVGLLVLIAAVLLLFTGRYPRPIFDFVLGMNRWVLRVAAYVSLMSDTYPPFRLDMGGDDPGTAKLSGPPPTGPGVATVAGPAAPSASTQASGRTGGWSAGRIVAVVVGAILVFSGVTVLGGGATALWVDRAVRDEAGFVTSGSGQLSTPSYALVSESIAVHSEGLDWSLSERLLGDVRVQARPGGAAPVFVGIASTADVRDYLAGVEHATVTEFRDGAAAYREQAGGIPALAPGRSNIWVAQASAAGTATLQWPIGDGDWTVVVMNADATRGVDARTEIGATMPFLDWLPDLLLIAGAVLLLLGLGLCIAAPPRRTTSSPTTASSG